MVLVATVAQEITPFIEHLSGVDFTERVALSLLKLSGAYSVLSDHKALTNLMARFNRRHHNNAGWLNRHRQLLQPLLLAVFIVMLFNCRGRPARMLVLAGKATILLLHQDSSRRAQPTLLVLAETSIVIGIRSSHVIIHNQRFLSKFVVSFKVTGSLFVGLELYPTISLILGII